MYETMFSPLSIGSVTLKNRIIFAPTTMGFAGEAYLSSMERIAAGGAAMLGIGDVPALNEPPSFGAPSPLTEDGFFFYQKLAEKIHRHGAAACAQLHMSDTDTSAVSGLIPNLKAGLISMDEMRRFIHSRVRPFITQMSADRIRFIAEGFGKSAARLEQAGFDMVQIHGDRMCGSFLSPLFNERNDRYGGSLKNRARFALDTICAVRSCCPELPLEFKLAVRMEHPHYGNAGVTEAELEQLIPLLEHAGINCFHVTLANHSSLSDTIPPANHPYFGKEGCFLPFADKVKKYTARPVCGVGGLSNPDFIEKQLASGRIDYAAMSRQLLADPEWPQKAASGCTDSIFRCIRCNKKCLGGLKSRQGTHCIYDDQRRK